MGRVKKVKVVMFVSPVLALRYTELAAKYGISRSELYRMTLERGYRSTLEWCGRQHEALSALDVDEVSAASSAAGGSGSVAPLAPTASVRADASPLVQLRHYARVLFQQDLEISEESFRAAVSAQAMVLGFGSKQAAGFVNGLVSDMFAQSAEGGAESLELGDDFEGDDDVGNGPVPQLD